jgi:hypothetical protein
VGRPLLNRPGVAVPKSQDLERILALPRRPPLDLASPRAEALVDLMTERLRRPDRPPGAPCGCKALGRSYCVERLLPVQAWTLWEAGIVGGVFGMITVGGGKTGLDILMPLVVPGCKVAALLIPPGLVEQFTADYYAWGEHFRVPSLSLGGTDGQLFNDGRPVIHVVPYSRFSREESTVLLESLKPDLVIGDEIHNLKNQESVRGGRAVRFFVKHSVHFGGESRLTGWSGSPTKDSIKNFAHLMAFSLGERSPLPLDPDVVDQWAACVDPSDWPAPAGELKRLCDPGEKPRDAVARRVRETPGVISTPGKSSVAASLVFRERKPKVPAKVAGLLKDLDATWTRPDGEELVEAIDKARCARELACGFYYRWIFPDDPDPDDVEAWFAARRAWHKELREGLKYPKPHLDSPLLLTRAAMRHHGGEESEGPVWESDAWPLWRDLRDSVRHETEAVWVDDYLVKDAAAWAAKSRGIVWYEHDAFGRAVSDLSGLPLHGGGVGAEARLRAEKGDRSIIASIRAHGTGRDGLQRLFAEQLVANPPSSGSAFEQLLGRLHRTGQSADEVLTVIYRQTRDMALAVDNALREAKFIEGMTGAFQKLLVADVEWRLS